MTRQSEFASCRRMRHRLVSARTSFRLDPVPIEYQLPSRGIPALRVFGSVPKAASHRGVLRLLLGHLDRVARTRL